MEGKPPKAKPPVCRRAIAAYRSKPMGHPADSLLIRQEPTELASPLLTDGTLAA